MNYQEAKTAYMAHKGMLAQKGVFLPPTIQAYMPDEFRYDFNLAMDAQPQLSGTDPNAGIPSFLTTLVDPTIFKVLFAPNKIAVIFGEQRKGTWLDQTVMFPIVEHVGEVSSYGDYQDAGGHSNVNTNFPQRQAYLFQTIKEYGELELERAGLARINWVSEIDQAAALALNKFSNFSYAFGIAGLQNYGLLNEPNLSAALSPSTKAAGNAGKWLLNGAPNATANEVYADIQSLYSQLVSQTNGLIAADSQMVLAMSPASEVALTITNSFNVNVYDLLKKNFPNMRVESAVQYGVLSASNTQGVAAGNLVQLIAESIEGQDTGYCSFNEKMRAHRIVPALSSWKQKVTGGTWGAVLRMPIAISQMVGI